MNIFDYTKEAIGAACVFAIPVIMLFLSHGFGV